MQTASEDTLTATEKIIAGNDQYIINTYGARKIAIERGDGARLWDVEGREYLDFFAGIAVCNLGHCHPRVTQAIQEQAATLLHVSNLYYIKNQVQLAAVLSKHSFAEQWFFCNGGAEANEAAIKLARRYWVQKGTPKPGIITASQSFHGRTLATVTATGQPKYHEGFAPMMHGFYYAPFNDIDALTALVTAEKPGSARVGNEQNACEAVEKESATAFPIGAIMLEPIQGEGGVRTPHPDYLKQVRTLCDEHDLLLILDEVQTGMGRTGHLFAHESFGITPDIMTLAKGLGNGVPIGAMGCTREVASGFSVGSHACTFGGNPLSCAAALATLEVMTEAGFLNTVEARGQYFIARLQKTLAKCPHLVEVRGKGFMVGIEFDEVVAPVVAGLIDRGIICGPAGPNVLRFVPPLIVTEADIDQVCDALGDTLGELKWL